MTRTLSLLVVVCLVASRAGAIAGTLAMRPTLAKSRARSVVVALASTEEGHINETIAWLENFVIKHNLCPFAAGVRSNTRTVVAGDENTMDLIVAEATRLRSIDPKRPATTLIVLPALTDSFEDLMELQEAAEARLHNEPTAAAIQLLAFHPAAEFETANDPADVALRSPHPIIHLLRDADVIAAEDQWAASHAPEAPPGIQARNAAYLRGLGFRAASEAAAEAVRMPPR